MGVTNLSSLNIKKASLLAAGLCVFVGLPLFVTTGDWLDREAVNRNVQIAAWTIFALSSAAVSALGARRQFASASAYALLAAGGATIVLTLFLFADADDVDKIGPLTALGSALGGLLGLIMVDDEIHNAGKGGAGK